MENQQSQPQTKPKPKSKTKSFVEFAQKSKKCSKANKTNVNKYTFLEGPLMIDYSEHFKFNLKMPYIMDLGNQYTSRHSIAATNLFNCREFIFSREQFNIYMFNLLVLSSKDIVDFQNLSVFLFNWTLIPYSCSLISNHKGIDTLSSKDFISLQKLFFFNNEKKLLDLCDKTSIPNFDFYKEFHKTMENNQDFCFLLEKLGFLRVKYGNGGCQEFFCMRKFTIFETSSEVISSKDRMIISNFKSNLGFEKAKYPKVFEQLEYFNEGQLHLFVNLGMIYFNFYSRRVAKNITGRSKRCAKLRKFMKTLIRNDKLVEDYGKEIETKREFLNSKTLHFRFKELLYYLRQHWAEIN